MLCNLWHREFPHMKVRERGEDTCTDCFKIKCQLRHLISKKKRLEGQVERDLPNNAPERVAIQMESKLDELLTCDCPEIEAELVVPIDEDSVAVSFQDLISLINEINDEIEKAKLHVTMHTV